MPETRELPTAKEEENEATALVKATAEKSLEKRGKKKDIEVLDEKVTEQKEGLENKKLKDMVREVLNEVVKENMPEPPADDQIGALRTEIDQKLEDLKSLLLRAKAQGKARIKTDEKEKDEKIKELYAGILKF